MRPLTFLLILTLSAAAQQAGTSVGRDVGAQQAQNSKLHADVFALISVDGTRMRLLNGSKDLIEEGRKQMMKTCPRCTSAFGDEWAKRMLARVQIDGFVQVIERTYEKYLNDEEVKQLIILWEAKNASKQVLVSAALKEKLTSVMPSIQSEILGGCVQVGAKLGAEVGQAIEKEHPEYLKPAAQGNGQ